MRQSVLMLCRTAAVLTAFAPGWRPTSIGHQDSATHPVRCHYEMQEDASRCDLVLESVELAWDAQVTRIGFPAPVPDEDGLLDVYLAVEPDGGAYAWCGTNDDVDDKDGRSGCAAIIVVASTVPDGILPWFLVHEFNHTLQWATDFNEGTLPVWEGTATAAELWTDAQRFHPDVGYIEDYQATPWLGLLGDGTFLWDEHQLWSYYEYGAALWVLHADATYGDGQGSGGRDLWLALAQEGLPNDPDVLDGYNTISGDWREALMDFSIQRTRIGTPLTPDWAAFVGGRGKLLPEALVREYPSTLTPAVQPYETGSVYWVLEQVPAGKQVKLTLDAVGDGEWGLLWVQGERSGWERGRSLEFIATDAEIWVGVVNLDHAAYAGNALTNALKAGQQELSLSLSLSEAPDTGLDTALDTADTGQAPDEETGCGGCGGGGGLGLWGLGLVALGLRRRR